MTSFVPLREADLLMGRRRSQFVDGFTELWGELNALHPSREGNGRSTRAFLSQLAEHAGRRVDWTALDPQRNVAASIASLRGDNTLMRQLTDHCVRSTPSPNRRRRGTQNVVCGPACRPRSTKADARTCQQRHHPSLHHRPAGRRGRRR